MKQYWVHYTHNNKEATCRVQSRTDEQAIHNGLGLARRYHPGEEIVFVRLEVLHNAK